MTRHRPFYAWMLGVLLLLPISCARKTVYVPDETRQGRIAQDLPVIGPWSEPKQALRCRMLLGRDSAGETDSIAAAFQIENVGNQPIELSEGWSTQHVQWRIGGRGMTADAVQPSTQAASVTLRLEPGQTFITTPVLLLIPSGTGVRQIDAQLTTSQGLLRAPAVPVSVSPAQWGQAEAGARLHLGSAQSSYVAGQGLMLRAFVENTGRDVLVLHPPDWSTLDIETPRERLLMQVKTADAGFVDLPSGQFWHGDIPNLPLLAPGTYKLRLEIDSPELPVPNRPAWHGKLVSNELVVEVVAK